MALELEEEEEEVKLGSCEDSITLEGLDEMEEGNAYREFGEEYLS